jgi:chromosome segregation ATPase
MLERLRFLGFFASNKGADVADEFTKFVVGLDPATASKAELDVLQSHLAEIDGKLARAEQDAAREHRETTAAQALVDQYLAAADILEKQVAAGTAEKTSLDKLLATLEKAMADLEREKEEDASAASWVAQLRESHDMMAAKLGAAKTQLKDAARALEQAKLSEERAEQRSRDAKEAAGLIGGGGKLNIALDALQSKAAEAQAKARAAELSTSAIKPTGALDGDAAIQAALAAAKAPETTLSSSDRLAALKARAGK